MNAHTREDDTGQAPPYVRATTMAPPQPRLRDTRSKSPALAAVLSMMPGLGQVYVGYYQRGFVHAAVVATLVTLLGTRFGVSLEWVEQWWPVAPMMFGAYLLARAIQDRRTSRTTDSR